jgi:hypothetical protein
VRQDNVGILATALRLFLRLGQTVKLAERASRALADQPWVDTVAMELVATRKRPNLITVLKLVQADGTGVFAVVLVDMSN